MYRVVLYSLLALVGVSWVMALFNFLPTSAWSLVLFLLVLVVASLIANQVFATLSKVPINLESSLVTALILYFLIIPPLNLNDYLWVIFIAVLTMASKYVLIWRGQHIFNPAAVGVALVASLGFYGASWWIATPVLFVPLLIAGVIVVKKVRRWQMVMIAILVAFFTFLAETWLRTGGVDISALGWRFLTSFPILFLAFYMLTEPFTLPPRHYQQYLYAALVGFLSATTLATGYFDLTPEMALLIGNLVVWPLLLQRKLILKLDKTEEIAADTYEYSFVKPSKLKFLPGQYLEWMLPHKLKDNRGVRRYLTIASAPESEYLQMAFKVPPSASSSYKKNLLQMNPGDKIIASQLAGDFVLPKKPDTKIAAVAGGIGVTPFTSHIRHLLAAGEARDYLLFYAVNTVAELAYIELWQDAEEAMSFKLIPVVANETNHRYETGFMTKGLIEKYAPDYLERTWYVSGPSIMVNILDGILRDLEVPESQIRKDFFPGIG